jgi:hypothetical protein
VKSILYQEAFRMKEEYRHGLKIALHSFADAAKRWEELRNEGAEDEALADHIRYEFGIMGGRTLPNGCRQEQKGGMNPWFQFSRGWNSDPEFELKGQKLINEVRHLMKIPFEDGYVALQQGTLF